jgi:ABC-2 type transport system permease protein
MQEEIPMKMLAICIKDLLHAFRSTFGLMFMFGIPLLLTGLFYFAFSGSSSEEPTGLAQPVRIVLVDTQKSGLAEDLTSMLSDASLTTTVTLISSSDEQRALAMLANGETDGVLLLPDAQNEVLELAVQQANSIQALVLRNVVSSVLDAAYAQNLLVKEAQNGLVISDEVSSAWQDVFSGSSLERMEMPVQAEQEKSIIQQILPNIMGGMMIFFAFFSAAFGTQSILTEEEHGTLQRLFTTGSPRQTVLAGKFLAVWITVVVQVVVLLGISGLVFKIAWGDLAGQFLLSVGIGTAAAGFGTILLSFIRSQRTAGLIMSGVVMITGFVGISAVFGGSGKITTSALFVPQGWALQGLLALQNGDSALWQRSAAVLVLWGLALFLVGKVRFDKRYRREA